MSGSFFLSFVRHVSIISPMKRITWVDIFKYFCIIAVMAEHAPSLTGLTDAFNSPFYVSGFFFASGYLYTHRDGFAEFLKRKSRQLLIPWLFFSLFIIVTARIFSFGEHDDLLTGIINNFLQIRLRGDEMWFVSALFTSFLFFYFVIKLYNNLKIDDKKKTILFIAVGFVLSVFFYIYGETALIGGKSNRLVWHLDYAPRGVFLMFLGYQMRHKWEKTFDSLNTLSRRLTIWAVLLAVVFVPQFTHHVFNDADWIIHHYVSSVIGIPAVVALSKVVKENKYMIFVGRNTITYYGFHGKFQSLLHAILCKVVGVPYMAICWSFMDSTKLLLEATILSYVFALVGSIVLIIPAFILEKYFPILVGKKNNK